MMDLSSDPTGDSHRRKAEFRRLARKRRLNRFVRRVLCRIAHYLATLGEDHERKAGRTAGPLRDWKGWKAAKKRASSSRRSSCAAAVKARHRPTVTVDDVAGQLLSDFFPKKPDRLVGRRFARMSGFGWKPVAKRLKQSRHALA